MSVSAATLAAYLDDLLRTREFKDYPGALNGLQVEHRGPVRCIGAAVDASMKAIVKAAELGVNFLLVHHGLFWGDPQPLVGAHYRKIAALLERDIAVYSSHLPLDAHETLGNNVLLARELGLEPTQPFAYVNGIAIGVAGECDRDTADLLVALDVFAARYGGRVRATEFRSGQRTRRWAICTGAGASSATLREAAELGCDTLIAGEGPHHTAVAAPELGLTVIYAGHYATEALGVQAAAAHLAQRFDLPWHFVAAPTGS
ncbi:MAG TPA: Nif3-like dinuclear metal center hexameric protein [Gemmatimonadaceae bacterium]|nr:Nif3-like dinuclear metal center hexameric protein [Gemmatimonadaceae bacterium]